MPKVSKTFFSPGFDLIKTEKEISYDLYVNSSGKEDKDKFVRVFPRGDYLSYEDLLAFKDKYFQVYIEESQRDLYLKSLVEMDDVSNKKKVEVLKDTAIGYLDKIFDPSKEFSTELLEDIIRGCRDVVEVMVDTLHGEDVSNIQDLMGELSFHDFYTYDHSVNVSMYSITIYRLLRPKAEKRELIHAGLGGLLHDLGKIKIPTSIINNPGKLSEEEFNQIKKHPDYGRDLFFKGEGIPLVEGIDLNVVSRVIHEHHENYNGTGYPEGIKGEDIHVLARVTAIADFFDAITTKRSYAKVLTTDEAVNLMAKTAGKKIDPDIFELFRKHLKVVLKEKSKLKIQDDFDPCQPHEDLPIQSDNGSLDEESDDNFGKIVQKS